MRRKIVCEPRKREPLFIPDQLKGGVLLKTYHKGYGNFWTGRQYVLEYEEIANGEPGQEGLPPPNNPEGPGQDDVHYAKVCGKRDNERRMRDDGNNGVRGI